MSFLDVTTPGEWDAILQYQMARAQDQRVERQTAVQEQNAATPKSVKYGGNVLGPRPTVVKTDTPLSQPVMPEDSKTRKGIPLHKGLFAYFPSALAAVAQVSRVCNDKHNPGQPIHWSKENSNDHQDALLRHLIDTASDPEARDPEDGTLLAAKVAWRALANLQVLHDNGVDIYADE